MSVRRLIWALLAGAVTMASLAAALSDGLSAADAAQALARPSSRPAGLGAPAEVAAVAVDVTARQVPYDLRQGRWRALGALELREAALGGLSGLALDADGAGFVAASDRGLLYDGRLLREGDRLSGIADLRRRRLRGPASGPRQPLPDDAEGLARETDGALLVSFEGDRPRIWRYRDLDGAAEPLALSDAFRRIQSNSGLEALAVAPDGAILAIPERSGHAKRPFPVFRRKPGAVDWDEGALPRDPPFLVTGADVDAEGRLYVLERDFSWLGGFSWRVRCADLADWPDLRPETLIAVRGGFDNMEAIAVWRDAQGRTRLTLVADDNFNALQRTLILDLVEE